MDARVATEADLPAVIETMALAFHEDPVWSWAFPDPERRLEQHRAVWGLLRRRGARVRLGLADRGLHRGSALDPARAARAAAARTRSAWRRWSASSSATGAARVLDTFERFDAAHPSERAALLPEPARRPTPTTAARGSGWACSPRTSRRIDAEGAPAYLESSNPANDHRYERLGFAPCGEFELGEDGPTVTQMWRDPR